MSFDQIMTELNARYKYKNVFLVIDELQQFIKEEGYSCVLLRPSDFNIDIDENRISVLINARDEITAFSIG